MQRIARKASAVAAALTLASISGAQTHPFLAQPVSAAAGGEFAVTDVNGDGQLDCVIPGFTGSAQLFLARGDGSFAPPRPIGPNGGQDRVLAADLDSDGDSDLVFESGSQPVDVWLGDGAGNFTRLPLSGLSSGIATLADVSGDGVLDLVTCSSQFQFQFHVGNGLGGFAPASTVTTLSRVHGPLVAGDFDADGDIDLVALTTIMVPGSARMRLFRNLGAGAFTEAVTSLEATPLAARDFDSDGDLDLAASTNGNLRILANNGAGAFTSGPIYFNMGGQGLTIADLDGDGDEDFAWSGNGTKTLDISLNNGAGGLGPVSSTPAPFFYQLGTLDADGDGRLDLLLGGSALSVARGLGGGSFERSVRSTSSAQSTFGDVTGKLGDLDNDGALDLVSAPLTTTRLDAWIGAGNGSFTRTWTHASSSTPTDVELADLDGDGRLDLIASLRNPALLQVFLGTTAGTFGAPSSFPQSNEPRELECADFDGDGDVDVLVRPAAGTALQLQLGDGVGGLTPPQPIALGGASASSLAVGDLNGDGLLDIAAGVAGNLAQVVFLPGLGQGAFGAPSFIATSSSNVGPVTALAIEDLDQDGLADLAALNSGANEIALLHQLAAGGFTLPSIYRCAAGGASSLQIVDVDGDGQFDLHVACPPVGASVRYSSGSRAYTAEAYFSGDGRTIDAADLNGDGRADLLQLESGAAVAVLLHRNTARHPACGAESYCIANANSSSSDGARLALLGSASIAQNNAVLSATRLVPNTTALAIFGPRRMFAPLGAGALCVGGAVRLGPPSSSNAIGTWTRALDLAQPPLSSGPGTLSGASWHFQVWYRDAASSHPSRINLTDAAQVTFCP